MENGIIKIDKEDYQKILAQEAQKSLYTSYLSN
jgi:hypothetical protein